MLRGLPGSGKSTYAKELIANEPNKWKRINRDSLRLMFSEVQNDKNEKYLLNMRDMLISQALQVGYNAIVDDLNLSKKNEARIRTLFAKKANIIVDDRFMTLGLEQLLYRNNNRPQAERVPEKTIISLYNQFCSEKVEGVKTKSHEVLTVKRFYIPYNPELPNAVIFDIDGTLALMNGREAYNWNKVGEDTVNEPVARIATLLKKSNENITIFVVSGRDGSCYDLTKQWLIDNRIPFDKLILREVGNNEKDAIIKERIYKENFEGKYNILAVFDDRNQVVEKWREMGLLCLQVAQGDF